MKNSPDTYWNVSLRWDWEWGATEVSRHVGVIKTGTIKILRIGPISIRTISLLPVGDA